MASAIIQGLINKKHYTPEEIACTSGPRGSGAKLAERLGIVYAADLAPLIKDASILVLACKPQQLDLLPPTLRAAAAQKLLISVLAGTTIAQLAKEFPGTRNIVRTMPNTPGQIGAGMTGYATATNLSPEDQQALEAILSALGKHLCVKEDQIDAVTAISGSGPAYIFEFTAAMREGGIALGLDFETANLLAIETVLGAAKLMAESDQGPEDLRNAVTSPKGTTAAALDSFSASDLRAIVAKAQAACHNRARELGRE